MWDFTIVLFKFLSLVATAMLLGGIFCFYLFGQTSLNTRLHIRNYIGVAVLIGLPASMLFFFSQIGAINQTGISGMFDFQLAGILAQSGLGDTTGLRVLGFILGAGLALLLFRLNSILLAVGTALVIVSLTTSFGFIGHVSTLAIPARFSLSVHVMAMALWAGSFYPLWFICGRENRLQVERIMKKFGEIAVAIVAVLIISGIYLLSQLLGSVEELFTTAYGISLTAKLVGVAALLLLAAANKFRLVPGLQKSSGETKLKRSIMLEMLVALSVLVLTAFFTTLVGPQQA